ncbi:hypothetical protein OK349_04225 [Sphingomonas sp. BT-65]|uniref:alpha/beta fold hydrolase n=1 Tax=Sphingomonas sp. BT-65 TaxID=2989821 RepID=UPI00223563D1|nr:alpha/beta fold hydrolase [Sphingomonas sp. BT-65]MCW4460901.1 hypothetical protein [Sphingomonas sp. BT-65]
MTRTGLIARLCVVALATATPAAAQIAPPPLVPLVMTAEPGPRRFVAQHRAVVNGKKLAYRSEVSETIVREKAGGKAAASLVAIAYLADGVRDPAKRPVIFAFNGGPGGASGFVNLLALGPQACARPAACQLAPNPNSPLDAADLVFVDPPDTGYSHILPGVDRQQFLSIDGDSAALTAQAISWLRDHGRLDSPVYLLGESYGTMRVVAMARDLRRSAPSVRVAGLMLAGNSLGYFQKGQMPDILYTANALPMMASIAWYHGRIDNRTQSWTEAVDKARLFARTNYIAALMQGRELAAGEKRAIMDALPAITGIDRSYFEKNDTIVVDDFNKRLLEDKGLVLDSYDGRETHPAGYKDDFSMMALFGASLDRYAAEQLQSPGLGPYLAFNLKLYPTWNYYTSGAMALDRTLAEEMRGSDRLRVLLVQGKYDTMTTLGNSEYIMRQTNVVPQRYAVAYYEGGHMLSPTTEFMNRLRAFVTP